MTGIRGVRNPATVERAEDESMVKEVADRLGLSVVRTQHLMMRYVLDEVAYNDFATFVLQEKKRTDEDFIRSVVKHRVEQS